VLSSPTPAWVSTATSHDLLIHYLQGCLSRLWMGADNANDINASSCHCGRQEENDFWYKVFMD
jgi:hypothetical protein